MSSVPSSSPTHTLIDENLNLCTSWLKECNLVRPWKPWNGTLLEFAQQHRGMLSCVPISVPPPIRYMLSLGDTHFIATQETRMLRLQVESSLFTDPHKSLTSLLEKKNAQKDLPRVFPDLEKFATSLSLTLKYFQEGDEGRAHNVKRPHSNILAYSISLSFHEVLEEPSWLQIELTVWTAVPSPTTNRAVQLFGGAKKNPCEEKGATIVEGDLLTFDADLLVHQINCVSKKAKGLSEAIRIKYPYADVYTSRTPFSTKPGQCIIRTDLATTELTAEALRGPDIAGLAAQISPGRPGEWASTYNVDPKTDTYDQRLLYLDMALEHLKHHVVIGAPYQKTLRVAFPWNIGCGLAGGNWSDYETRIHTWARNVRSCNVQVFIVQPPVGFKTPMKIEEKVKEEK